MVEAQEFAFGVDTIRALEFSTFYALRDDSYETNTLAATVAVMRHPGFRQAFDARVDALLAERELGRRDEAGYLVSDLDPGKWSTKWNAALHLLGEQLEKEGFAEQACETTAFTCSIDWRPLSAASRASISRAGDGRRWLR